MHQKAIIYNPQAAPELRHVFYQWETEAFARCVLKLMTWRGGEVSESEVMYLKATGIFRVWIDGEPVGDPAWN